MSGPGRLGLGFGISDRLQEGAGSEMNRSNSSSNDLAAGKSTIVAATVQCMPIQHFWVLSLISWTAIDSNTLQVRSVAHSSGCFGTSKTARFRLLRASKMSLHSFAINSFYNQDAGKENSPWSVTLRRKEQLMS